MRSTRIRPNTSAEPPAGYATIIVIARAGYTWPAASAAFPSADQTTNSAKSGRDCMIVPLERTQKGQVELNKPRNLDRRYPNCTYCNLGVILCQRRLIGNRALAGGSGCAICISC